MNQITEVPLDEVIVGSRKRSLNMRKVEELSQSLKVSGLLQPILVTHEKRLVHGHHRLEAARLLGWERIPAMVEEMTDLEAELAEIDENLVRSELTVLERAELLLRRDEILREKGLRAEAGDNQHRADGGGATVAPPKTTRELASEMGIAERTAQVYVQIARGTTPEVRDLVRATPLADSTSELTRLARIKDADVQRRVAETVLAENVPVASALRLLRTEERRGAEVREAVKAGKAPEARILQGDVMEMLRTLPEESVHCLVTSPPYYGLRDYGIWLGGSTECDHRPERASRADRPRSGLTGSLEYVSVAQELDPAPVCARCGARRDDRMIGLEGSLQAWLARMVAVFRAIRRVIRRDGTVWINIGDAYACPKPREAYGDQSQKWKNDGEHLGGRRATFELPPKSLLLQPHRLAVALQEDGWIVRADICWHKPNVLPQSVSDRPTNAHEHVLLLAREERYYYDAEAVREDATAAWGGVRGWREGELDNARRPRPHRNDELARAGRNMRDVWAIASDPFPGAHFATYPRALVERCLRAGTSEAGCCAKCGAQLERVVEPSPEYARILDRCGDSEACAAGRREATRELGVAFADKGESAVADYITIGWRPTCNCEPSDPVACTVLDPFLGSGTTGLVAHRLGRSSIGIELNPRYAEMARRRIFGESLEDGGPTPSEDV